MTSTPLNQGIFGHRVVVDVGTMGGGTPLVMLALPDTPASDKAVLVKLKVLLTYEVMITELQQELNRYKAMLDMMHPRFVPETVPEPVLGVNALAVDLLNSIMFSRPNEETVLRDSDI